MAVALLTFRARMTAEMGDAAQLAAPDRGRRRVYVALRSRPVAAALSDALGHIRQSREATA
jgi:hypothetical protein